MKLRKKPRRQMSESLVTAMFIILSGGYQDAYTYCCRGQVFANAQTGNLVLMGINMFKGEWQLSIRYIIPIVSFLVGIYIAESIHYKYKYMQKIHWRQVIVACEIIILFGVGFIPQRFNLAANVLVSFVCAMQMQTFRKLRGHLYASTMCIGNMRSGIGALHEYFRCHDKRILEKARIYLGVVLLFIFGAAIGGTITAAIGEKAIWVSCILLSISFTLMFIHDEIKK